MSAYFFLPDTYSRATKTIVAVAVNGAPDLTDPMTGRTLVPTDVEIVLTLIEGTDRGDRTTAYVSVAGPRRLKSGAEGQPIKAIGWEFRSNRGPKGYVSRPEWLTDLLGVYLPEGWDPFLLDLGGAS